MGFLNKKKHNSSNKESSMIVKKLKYRINYDVFFCGKLKELKLQNNTFIIPSKLYKVGYRIVKYKKPHMISKEFILLAEVDMENIMVGELLRSCF